MRNSERTLPDPLADDVVLAHVGLHKTGTTSLQNLMDQQREVLATHGVTYPANANQVHASAHHGAALALSGTSWGPDAKRGVLGDPNRWPHLVEAVTGSPGRVVVSSEFFGDLRGAPAQRFVDELGRDRLHVVIGIRNLALVLPSVWQQTLKLGKFESFEDWLRRVYLGPRKVKNPRSFWSRYDYGPVVARWADRLGPDRVSVVIVDDAEHSWLPSVFEAMLALPPGILTGIQPTRINRSMTAAEADAVLQLNTILQGELDWQVYEPMVREGAILEMVENRRPGPDEASLITPAWAAEHAIAEAPAMLAQIDDLGVGVLGRREALTTMPEKLVKAYDCDEADGPAVGQLPIQAYALALAGAIRGAQTWGVSGVLGDNIQRLRVNDTTTRSLAQILITRVSNRIRRT